MKKLLFQLDTDALPNTFDTVVAYDGGADHVTQIAGITPDNVGTMVDGAVFTRAPKDKKNTALFVSGSDLAAGEALLEAITNRFFADFRVSVMLDSNGSNTTAAAAVAKIVKHVPAAGKGVLVLAGTGPVGQRAAVMLAREGAEVTLSSRKLDRAESTCAALNAKFEIDLAAAQVNDEASAEQALDGKHIVLATGAAGVQLLSESAWKDHSTLQIVADANASPPMGIEGVEMMDKATERHGKICYGAIGFGPLKIEVHRACIARLFESNDQVLDGEEIYALAKEMA